MLTTTILETLIVKHGEYKITSTDQLKYKIECLSIIPNGYYGSSKLRSLFCRTLYTNLHNYIIILKYRKLDKDVLLYKIL